MLRCQLVLCAAAVLGMLLLQRLRPESAERFKAESRTMLSSPLMGQQQVVRFAMAAAEKLQQAFRKLSSHGKLTEADVKTAMRDVRMALLEADVNYKVVKDFIARVTERAVGSDILDSLTPSQQVIKIVNEELTALMGGQSARLTY